MERKHIPCDSELRQKPCWIRAYTEPGKPPMFHCPNGHNSVMSNHTVEADGTVNGSVKCPECDYHEFVILDGWNSEGNDQSCP